MTIDRKNQAAGKEPGEVRMRYPAIYGIGRCLVAAALHVCWGQGIITTVAGNGMPGFSGDGGPAVNAALGEGIGSSLYVGADAAGNFYITDTGGERIRKVTTAGIISTLVRTPVNGPVAAEADGNILVASGAQIKRVSPTGAVTVVAGTLIPGFSGDGGPATAAQMFPTGVAVDGSGNIFVAESLNHRIRRIVKATGIITTVAGSGTSGFSGDNGPATQAALSLPQGLAVDTAGNVYFADGGMRIRKWTAATGIITTVAGNGSPIGISDNVPATSSGLVTVSVAVDGAGNLYYADIGRVRKVNAAGLVSTIAGTLLPGFSGDGGPAIAAQLNNPTGVAVDGFGSVYIVDAGNRRIRKIGGDLTPPPPPQAAISLSSGQMVFIAAGTNPPSQTLTVSSSSTQQLSFTAVPETAQGGPWLSVAPGAGTTPAGVAVTVNAAGLAAGNYAGSITITAEGAANSPRRLPVTLTVIAGGSGTQPAISSGGVVNVSGYQNRLAPGAVFVIFGRSLGPDALVAGAAPDYPQTLGGTAVTFTGGGTVVTARLVYVSAGQVAGLLPSSIPPGTYAVRVSRNGLASAAENVTVAARSFGIATANSAGSGPAQVTIGNVNGGVSLVRFTSGSVAFGGFTWTLTPARPGDTLVIWGTGGGADAANDTGGSSGDQTAAGRFQVLVGGRSITPLYAGASQGFPGLWQINFTLPADIAPDCFAPLQVSANGELSNATTIAIAPAGMSACVDADTPPAVLSKLDSGGTIVGGAFSVVRVTDVTNSIVQELAAGGVFRWTAAQWLTGTPLRGRTGQCTVYDRVIPPNGLDPAGPGALLDAGARLGLSGPGVAAGAGLARTAGPLGPSYQYGATPPSFAAGTYNLTGTGGSDVGAFRVDGTYPGSFTVTNLGTITAVDRGQPLTISWTGAGVDVVVINFNSIAQVAGGNRSVSVVCLGRGSPGSFVVPASALGALLPAPAFSGLTVTGQANPGMFTAPLTAGGETDFGSFGGAISFTKSLTVR